APPRIITAAPAAWRLPRSITNLRDTFSKFMPSGPSRQARFLRIPLAKFAPAHASPATRAESCQVQDLPNELFVGALRRRFEIVFRSPKFAAGILRVRWWIQRKQ